MKSKSSVHVKDKQMQSRSLARKKNNNISLTNFAFSPSSSSQYNFLSQLVKVFLHPIISESVFNFAPILINPMSRIHPLPKYKKNPRPSRSKLHAYYSSLVILICQSASTESDTALSAVANSVECITHIKIPCRTIAPFHQNKQKHKKKTFKKKKTNKQV